MHKRLVQNTYTFLRAGTTFAWRSVKLKEILIAKKTKVPIDTVMSICSLGIMMILGLTAVAALIEQLLRNLNATQKPGLSKKEHGGTGKNKERRTEESGHCFSILLSTQLACVPET